MQGSSKGFAASDDASTATDTGAPGSGRALQVCASHACRLGTHAAVSHCILAHVTRRPSYSRMRVAAPFRDALPEDH